MKPTGYQPTKILNSLEVGGELELPLSKREKIAKAITRLHKLGDKNFTTKKVSDKLFILRREK